MTFYRSILFIGFSIIFGTSCKKDQAAQSSGNTSTQVYDTVYPLSYFPAYPGSWWKYVDSNNDTTENTTAPGYLPDSYIISGQAYESGVHLVPYYNDIPIWGYDAHEGYVTNSASTPLRTILSDTLPVGSSWTVFYWGGTGVDRKILARDTTIAIGTNSYFPTIVVEEYYTAGPPTNPWIAKRYYTRDVGLVREELHNYLDSTVNTRNLIDFYINQ